MPEDFSESVEASGGVRVSFTVKELLAGINSNLAAINTKLDLKADAHELERLSKRVDAQGDRMGAIERRFDENDRREERERNQKRDQFTKREKVIGLALGVAAVVTPYILHGGIT